MVSPMVSATIKSVLITFCSYLIGCLLKPDDPPHLLSLVIYSAIATPPNYQWQKLLERWFPGYRTQKLKIDDGGRGVEVEKKLNIANTVVKIGLDQSVAAVANVVAYIGGTRLLRGVPVHLCIRAVREVRCFRSETLNILIPANLARDACWLQVVACCQCGTACLCASRAENSRWQSRGAWMGDISGSAGLEMIAHNLAFYVRFVLLTMSAASSCRP